MPSVPERLASLESLTRETRRMLEELHDDIHGGGAVEWAQSVDGKVHKMRGNLAAADKLMDALRQDIVAREKQNRSRLKRWQWVYLAVCATLAAMSPYVVLLVH